ncbi:hypothetical protein CHU32_14645 [Superficieibacter electus]|uniref:Sec-independent protein translocase protein TatB n=1 Tax=Superficieibacter electus TaxID=2022662 RepID=A0A2P5GNF9_9ENTR|nr:Sec-independent protein translocase protein TatB [Superficieibacter electus]POP43608.1 hypothetical protein CHU33_15355 [Superficieibacter electus]POP48076.1 hypothetical protein CHU32_14645 [Superficieibacter electus]
MFGFGFGELLLVFVIGLIVLGPTRLPVVARTVISWIATIRSLGQSLQNELAQELKVLELEDKLKALESLSAESLTPELKSSLEALRQATDALRRPLEAEVIPAPTIGTIQSAPEE